MLFCFIANIVYGFLFFENCLYVEKNLYVGLIFVIFKYRNGIESGLISYTRIVREQMDSPLFMLLYIPMQGRIHS
jgi:hypothetical protein